VPILARLNANRQVVPVAFQITDLRRLDFQSIDGSDVLQWDGDEYIIQSGITGLGIPPRDVITETVPGLEGGRIRDIRTGPRTVTLPFVVVSNDYLAASHQAQMAHLRSFVDYRTNDYVGDEGTFDLVATSEAGQRLLRCVYLEGMEGVEGVASGNGSFLSTFDAKLLAVQPYWRGQEWSTPIVSVSTGSMFLSNDPANGFPRAISASVALGAGMPVIVGGDVPSPAVIELTGPSTATSITSPQGLNVQIGALTAGQQLIIDTGRSRRVLLDGVSRWDLVGDSPQWRPLPPGNATISVVVNNATAATSARVYGTSLWETAW
jgi:hypothetical protein